MLDLAILGLLHDTPHHGYELKQRLSELGFWTVSFGSLYPALRRMERRDWIEAVRSTGRRKAYRLTEAGRLHFDQMLRTQPEAPEEERRFHLRLAFFRYLEPALRVTTLERRRRQLVTSLRDARRTLREATARTETIDRYTRALMERRVRATQADIAWLDELIAAERAARHQRQPDPQESGGTAWTR